MPLGPTVFLTLATACNTLTVSRVASLMAGSISASFSAEGGSVFSSSSSKLKRSSTLMEEYPGADPRKPSESTSATAASCRPDSYRGDGMGEPITLQDRVYTWSGSQSHYRTGYIPGVGANHTPGQGICESVRTLSEGWNESIGTLLRGGWNASVRTLLRGGWNKAIRTRLFIKVLLAP
eukprot:1178283-Prorocentrum_minimum.AAC.3